VAAKVLLKVTLAIVVVAAAVAVLVLVLGTEMVVVALLVRVLRADYQQMVVLASPLGLLAVVVLAQSAAATLQILAATEGLAEVPAFLERQLFMLVAVEVRLVHSVSAAREALVVAVQVRERLAVLALQILAAAQAVALLLGVLAVLEL
jgi:hypothetical protein